MFAHSLLPALLLLSPVGHLTAQHVLPYNITETAACVLTAAPPDPESKCCGIDIHFGNKQFGSETAFIGQYPWLVNIEYHNSTWSKNRIGCGGALISGRYVLTAGHCVVTNVATPTNVRLGEYDIDNDVNAKDCVEAAGGGEYCTDGAKVISIEKIIPHPEFIRGYSNTTRWQLYATHDIALLRLAELAPYTDFIRPICLPTTDLTLAPPDNFTLYAAGWGAVNVNRTWSSVRQHVDLPLISKDKCQQTFDDIQLETGQMCAGGVKGHDSCGGDSGAPLMYENKLYFEAIGVISFGNIPCGGMNIPSVNTNVYDYNTWIRSKIEP